MGFFRGLAEAISSVGSAICSGTSSVCSAIGGALLTGFGGIAALATAIIGPVVASPEVALIMVAIQSVASMVCAIAESVGTSLYIKGIEEQYRIKAPGEFWRTLKAKGLTLKLARGGGRGGEAAWKGSQWISVFCMTGTMRFCAMAL